MNFRKMASNLRSREKTMEQRAEVQREIDMLSKKQNESIKSLSKKRRKRKTRKERVQEIRTSQRRFKN